MCGRYTLAKPSKTIKDHFDPISIEISHKERYNIAPTQEAPVVLNSEGSRKLVGMRWGLIPPWVKEKKSATPLINARSETVQQKPAFKNSFRNHRCLVPADGFIEWIRGEKAKTPCYIYMKPETLFAFAGIWSLWNGEQPALKTFSILTTEANSLLKPIHHRMPVILKSAQYNTWLDPETGDDTLLSMLLPYSTEGITTQTISREINSPKNDHPGCLAPVS